MNLDRPIPPDPYDLLPPSVLHGDQHGRDRRSAARRVVRAPQRGRQEPVAAAVLVRFPRRDPRLRGDLLRPGRADGSGFWHWVVVNLPASVTELATGAASTRCRAAARSASATTTASQDYGGAAPPPG